MIASVVYVQIGFDGWTWAGAFVFLLLLCMSIESLRRSESTRRRRTRGGD